MKKLLWIAIIAVVLGLGMYSVVQSLKYAALALQLQQTKTELRATNASNDELRLRMARVNAELEQAINEAQLQAAINASFEQAKNQVVEQQTALLHQANELRNSPDEITRHWADTALPADTVRLLQQASATGHSNASNPSTAAGEFTF